MSEAALIVHFARNVSQRLMCIKMAEHPARRIDCSSIQPTGQTIFSETGALPHGAVINNLVTPLGFPVAFSEVFLTVPAYLRLQDDISASCRQYLRF